MGDMIKCSSCGTFHYRNDGCDLGTVLQQPRPIDRGKAITGRQIVRLMRQNDVTIKQLSERTGITMKRIREVRFSGLSGCGAARDWVQAITGIDPGPDFNEDVLR